MLTSSASRSRRVSLDRLLDRAAAKTCDWSQRASCIATKYKLGAVGLIAGIAFVIVPACIVLYNVFSHN